MMIINCYFLSYGIELDDEGESNRGTIICKLKGTYVGKKYCYNHIDSAYQYK